MPFIDPQTGETLSEFENLINLWAKEWSKRYGTELNWVDYKGSKFKKAQKTTFHSTTSILDLARHRLQIACSTIQATDLKEKLSDLKWEDKQTNTNLQQIERNDGDVENEFTFNKAVERNKQTRIAVTSTAELDINFEIDFGIPPIGGAKASTSIKLSRSKTNETIEGEKQSWAINQKIRCPAKRVTSASAIIHERCAKFNFEKEVALDGYVVVCCKSKITHKKNPLQTGPHKKWPIPVQEMFSDLKEYSKAKKLSSETKKIIRQQLERFKIQPDKITFLLKGEIESQEGVSVEVITKNFPTAAIRYTTDTIRAKLSEYYKNQLSIERLFYPNLPIPLHAHYINLSIIKQTSYQKEVDKLASSKYSYDESQDAFTHMYGKENDTISVSDILPKVPSDSSKTLVTGTAGIGKTIFSKYLAHTLASQTKSKYTWIFRIALRNFLQENIYPVRADRDYTTMDILSPECLKKDKLKLDHELNENELLALEQEILDPSNADKVLFILDGYDEVAENLPPYLEKTLKDLLNKPHVILTSRSFNLHGLQETYGFRKNAHYEITGFTPQNIEQYINDFFNHLDTPNQDKADALLAFLKRNPNIEGACRIPINIELVCSTWDEQPITDQAISMSKLYHEVMVSLCARALEKEGLKISNYDDTLLLKPFQIRLAFLDFLAYQSITQSQLFMLIAEARKYILQLEELPEDGSEKLVREQKALGFIKPIPRAGTN